MKVPIWKRLLAGGVLGCAALLGVAGPARALSEGDRAPEFSVPSTTGKEIALKDFLGKKSLVVFFYYACFTNT